MNGKKFWKVEVDNTKYSGENGTVYVIANTAAEAEKRALLVMAAKMKRNNGKVEGRFYVWSAEFVGEIH